VVAAECREDAHDKRFDLTRTFVRAPARGMEWWWLMVINHDRLFAKFRRYTVYPLAPTTDRVENVEGALFFATRASIGSREGDQENAKY